MIGTESHDDQRSGWTWPLWGAAAGVFGAIGHLFTMETFSNDLTLNGAAVIEEMNFRAYHVGVVAGMIAVFCVLAFAAGWRRWVADTGRGSLMTELVSLALVGSAGAMLLGYGFKGALAVYLPGGSDEGFVAHESLMALFMFNDFGPFIAWYGVAMAAVGIAWVALRERQLPVWLGVVAALFAIVPFAFLVAVGLPGFPGVVDPFWMVINGAGMALVLRRRSVRPVVRSDATAVGAPAMQG